MIVDEDKKSDDDLLEDGQNDPSDHNENQNDPSDQKDWKQKEIIVFSFS